MLYYLHELTAYFSPFRLFGYISFRAFAAGITAFVLTMLIAPSAIGVLASLKAGQPIRSKHVADLYAVHGKKEGTPTMGGVLILFSVLVSTLLWARLGNPLIWMTLSTFLYMGAVGFIDDVLKVRHRNSRGLSARVKFALQVGWALIMGAVLLAGPFEQTHALARSLMVPFMKAPLIFDMGLLGSLLFITVVLVGSANAVNLTDGLDGLAIGCSNAVALAYLAIAYIAGHAIFASYLQVPHVPGASELAVFCAALLGAGMGLGGGLRRSL